MSDTSQPDPLLGRTIDGRYEINRLIGKNLFKGFHGLDAKPLFGIGTRFRTATSKRIEL